MSDHQATDRRFETTGAIKAYLPRCGREDTRGGVRFARAGRASTLINTGYLQVPTHMCEFEPAKPTLPTLTFRPLRRKARDHGHFQPTDCSTCASAVHAITSVSSVYGESGCPKDHTSISIGQHLCTAAVRDIKLQNLAAAKESQARTLRQHNKKEHGASPYRK